MRETKTEQKLKENKHCHKSSTKRRNIMERTQKINTKRKSNKNRKIKQETQDSETSDPRCQHKLNCSCELNSQYICPDWWSVTRKRRKKRGKEKEKWGCQHMLNCSCELNSQYICPDWRSVTREKNKRGKEKEKRGCLVDILLKVIKLACNFLKISV